MKDMLKKAAYKFKQAGTAMYLSICLILLFLISLFISHNIKSVNKNENLEDTFGREGEAYKRLSVFFSPKLEMDRSDIMELRNKLTVQLGNSPSVETSQQKTVFLDAYEGGGTLQVSYQNTFLLADAAFVGGNYFDFHRMSFLRGNKFSEEDLIRDKAVISESLSFALFGSSDSIGKTIWINERGIIVCGVIADKNRQWEKLMGSDTKKIYLPYGSMEELGCSTALISYEILLPEPLEGFAMKTVEEAFGINRYEREASLREKEISIVEETNRFHMERLFKTGMNLNKRTMKTVSIVFPDWENEKVIVENRLLFIYVMRMIIGIWLIKNLFLYIWKKRKEKEIKIL
ncbi:MAG: ABC transporter permease [Lachnospiraceae bacterium]|nr:ABC transporter permease [Lachnospiraceae bacterium]